MMFKELAPECRSTCGLSNVSNGTPEELRDIINRTYLMVLMKHGLDSAIVNAFDKDLVDIVRGRRNDLVEAVRRTLDGEAVEPKTQEETDYVKTAKVLMGESLYSHSWLKL
jgi:5-methyltetrahydrofolate corrinoid/iron sulfur protein methyltransferase